MVVVVVASVDATDGAVETGSVSVALRLTEVPQPDVNNSRPRVLDPSTARIGDVRARAKVSNCTSLAFFSMAGSTVHLRMDHRALSSDASTPLTVWWAVPSAWYQQLPSTSVSL